jgi:hypothetical protein
MKYNQPVCGAAVVPDTGGDDPSAAAMARRGHPVDLEALQRLEPEQGVIRRSVCFLPESLPPSGWSPRGAHLVLQIRTRVLDDEWENTFRRWYPDFHPQVQPAEMAA